MTEQDRIDHQRVFLTVSDPAQLPTLVRWLKASGSLQIERTSSGPGPGEQGAIDVLSILASSSALIAALKILPEFIRSRRSGFHIEMTVKGKSLTIDVSNASEVLPILEKLVDA
jgi:hypothetical protein